MGDSPINQVLRSTLFRLDLGATLENAFKILAHADTSSAQHLAAVIEQNQAYCHFLRNSDAIRKRKGKGMGGDDDAASDENATAKIAALLGKTSTRNAIVCIRLLRVLGSGLPRAENDTLSFDAQKMLKRAMAIEDFSTDRRLAHGDTNFTGGLLYDWLFSLYQSQKTTPKAALTYLDELWRESFRTAQIAYHVGASLKTFKYQNYAFSGGLVLNIGKFLMATLFPTPPSWAEFVESCKESDVHEWENAYQIQERKQFPVTHNELSALVVSFYSPLRVIEKSVCYYQEPYVLRKQHPDLFRLAVVFSVAQKMSSLTPDARRNAKTPGELLTKSQARWLREIGIHESVILNALKAVQEALK